MSELLGLLGAVFSNGFELVLFLVALSAGLLFVILVLSPFEALQWWAGWVDDRARGPAGPSGEPPRREPPPRAAPVAAWPEPGSYVVFLPGVGALGTRIDEWERGLVNRLAAGLPGNVVLAGIFPFTVRDDTLIRGRATAWFWRWLARLRQEHPSLIARLIDWRNLTQVFVSMDPRYGPIFNFGVSEKLLAGLIREGYDTGSQVPVVVIGYSGAAQVALGAAPYLAQESGAAVTVISLGGVLGDDPALGTVKHLYHLWGARDIEARLAALAVPARWPIARRSRWNRAIQAGRLSATCLGQMVHAGAGGYLDPNTITLDGRSYLEVTASKVIEIVVGPPASGPPEEA
jgi:hypothetical protein